MPTLAVLGSTGSVGKTTAEVLAELEESHRVVALVARSDTETIIEQARRFRPLVVGLSDPEAAAQAREPLATLGIPVLEGPDAAVNAIRETGPDQVMGAITGAAGLASSMETVERGATLLLANKEALVMAGHLLLGVAKETGARLLPVDSEHSAIFQCLNGEESSTVRRIILTASGGPFADLPVDEFPNVTIEDALNHPTWKMGPKITVDSATMMNKALEIVEARWLFDVDADNIDVLIHRQSIVHSMVEYMDGSIIAQMGVPSMTVPVRYALAWPHRLRTEQTYFDLAKFSNLTFEEPDLARFPALSLGRQVARDLGLAGTVLNASNEMAVEYFLSGRLTFDRIASVNATVLDRMNNRGNPSLEEILDADRWARAEAERCMST